MRKEAKEEKKRKLFKCARLIYFSKLRNNFIFVSPLEENETCPEFLFHSFFRTPLCYHLPSFFLRREGKKKIISSALGFLLFFFFFLKRFFILSVSFAKTCQNTKNPQGKLEKKTRSTKEKWRTNFCCFKLSVEKLIFLFYFRRICCVILQSSSFISGNAKVIFFPSTAFW